MNISKEASFTVIAYLTYNIWEPVVMQVLGFMLSVFYSIF